MSNWFTDIGKNVGQDIGSVGTGVGQTVGGLLTPVGGFINNVLGTTQTSIVTTTAPDAGAQSSSKTLTIFIVVLAVVTLVTIGFIALKSSKTT